MKIHPPLYFVVGDTWPIQGNLAYADGTPFDLGAGCSIQWSLEDSAGNTVLSYALGTGITVLDAAAGTCLVTVPPADSATVAIGAYVDQLQAVDPTGLVSTQFTGPVNAYQSFFV